MLFTRSRLRVGVFVIYGVVFTYNNNFLHFTLKESMVLLSQFRGILSFKIESVLFFFFLLFCCLFSLLRMSFGGKLRFDSNSVQSTQMSQQILIYANLVILATPVRIIGHQVVSLGHLGGFIAF